MTPFMQKCITTAVTSVLLLLQIGCTSVYNFSSLFEVGATLLSPSSTYNDTNPNQGPLDAPLVDGSSNIRWGSLCIFPQWKADAEGCSCTAEYILSTCRIME